MSYGAAKDPIPSPWLFSYCLGAEAERSLLGVSSWPPRYGGFRGGPRVRRVVLSRRGKSRGARDDRSRSISRIIGGTWLRRRRRLGWLPCHPTSTPQEESWQRS